MPTDFQPAFSASASSGTGRIMAAIPAMRMVRMMTLKPEEMPLVRGRTLNTQLAAIDMATSAPIKWFSFEGGMMIARNMP